MHRNKGCLQQWKKGTCINDKTSLVVFNMQMHRRKSFLIKRLRFDDFFFFFGYIFFSPHIMIGKKFQESKTQDFISSDIRSDRTSENWDFLPKFLFSGFFFQKLFLWLSYIDSSRVTEHEVINLFLVKEWYLNFWSEKGRAVWNMVYNS